MFETSRESRICWITLTLKVYAHWFKDVKTDANGQPRSRGVQW